jgi:branched-subunit amino acid transport protein
MCILYKTKGIKGVIMTLKVVALLLILAIVFFLARGLFFLVQGGTQSPDRAKRMMRSLAFRVFFSVALIVVLVVGGQMGWIKPHGVNPFDAPQETLSK